MCFAFKQSTAHACKLTEFTFGRIDCQIFLLFTLFAGTGNEMEKKCSDSHLCIYEANIGKVCVRVCLIRSEYLQKSKKRDGENERRNHEQVGKGKPNPHCICKHYHLAMQEIALHFNSHNKCNVCIFTRMEYNVCHVIIWGCVCECGLELFSLNVAHLILHPLFISRSAITI